MQPPESSNIHPQWRRLSDVDREREYSPSSCVGGDITPYLEQYRLRSDRARLACAEAGARLSEVRYGPDPSHTIDLMVPNGWDNSVPLVVYLHGGYWQQLSKVDSFFAADDCRRAGLGFAAVDYTLAPAATLDQIVAECRGAVAALREQSPSIGLASDRFVLCGSSAGAHLCAMVALDPETDWRPAGAVLVSGIYELEPLLGTNVNDAVGMDRAAALRNSPQLADLHGFPSTAVAWGDNETDEFKRQSQHLAHSLMSAGTEVTAFEVPGRNHFDVVLDAGDPETALGRALHRLVHGR